MKRSAALTPLSRDHHQALAVALALTRADQATASNAVERFRGYWESHGRQHFAIEEAVLIPALPSTDAEWTRLCERMTSEHRRLRALASTLDGGRVDRVVELGTLLRDHVRFEEREVFPYLEAQLDASTLEELGRQLAHDCGARRQ
jgi:hemerythrin-like domain-containing protein